MIIICWCCVSHDVAASIVVVSKVSQVERRTDPVGISLMVVSKVCGSPAVDRRADILVGADDDGKDDQEQNGVSVVKSVDQVVVVASARTRELGDCSQHPIHPQSSQMRCHPTSSFALLLDNG